MFLIRDALKAYHAKMGADAVTFDASQGDGGASLPGVPRELLERALEIQIEHGSAYDQPWGTVRFRQAAAEQYWKLDAASGWGTDNIVFVQGGRDGLQKAYGAMVNVADQEIGGLRGPESDELAQTRDRDSGHASEPKAHRLPCPESIPHMGRAGGW